MSTMPTDEQILDHVRSIHATNPELGRAKLLAKLKADHEWILSDNRLKRLLDRGGLKRIAELSRISLPENALAAQEEFREKSKLHIKLYGREQFEYGVKLGPEVHLIFGGWLKQLKEDGVPVPWEPTRMIDVARSYAMESIFHHHWSAGQKVGLVKENIGRQMEAEYGVNPIPYIQELTPALIEQRKVESSERIILLRCAAKLRKGKSVVAPNEDGALVWDAENDGEFAVTIVKINKENGTKCGKV